MTLTQDSNSILSMTTGKKKLEMRRPGYALALAPAPTPAPARAPACTASLWAFTLMFLTL